jgi:hypothetical protein
MNFIDKALEEITNGEDFVQAMAEIYEHTEVREKLDKFPAWIRNIITVIDYDTELSIICTALRSLVRQPSLLVARAVLFYLIISVYKFATYISQLCI